LAVLSQVFVPDDGIIGSGAQFIFAVEKDSNTIFSLSLDSFFEKLQAWM
jgi:hypothetical protein